MRGSAQSPTGALRGETAAVGPQGEPVPVGGVSLTLKATRPGSASLSTFSDNEGQYQFVALPAGSYVLEASLEGFKTVDGSVTLAPGETAVHNIVLELAEVHQEIQVRDTAPSVSQQNATLPAVKLSAPQLSNIPVAEQKFKEALPLLPGVIRTQNGTLYIKGRSENQGMLLLDSAQAVDPVTGSFVIDVPIDAIQSLDVYKAPFSSEFGGFTGGMTSIGTKPPSSQWYLSMHDLNPSIRGKSGHIVGFARAEPRIYFSGPLGSNRLSFSESFLYELRKENIRGLAWPHDETKKQGFNSLTSFQYIVSPQHLLSVNVNVFPRRQQFANINALLPQPASSDYGQRGYSIGLNDSYQFNSGGVLTSVFKYTRVSSYAHGQGPGDTLVTPDGLGGNYFNAWERTSNQQEALETFQTPMKEWLGKHQLKVGGDFIHRDFDGFSRSHPVLLLREDGSVAERIDFTGPGLLAASNTQVAAFVQDHWALSDRLAVDLGGRFFGQTNGESADFAPRLGVVYALDSSARTILRGGIGVFYDRLPLLAGDFSDNPARTVTMIGSQGTVQGIPLTFRNVCAQKSESGPQILASCSNFSSTPYNITWRLEADHKLQKNVTVRFGYLSSRTYNTFVVDPVDLPATNPLLMLSNRGAARYHEYEAGVDYRPNERSTISFTYIHSRSRGDLNSVDGIFVPFEQPVIRRNVYGNLPDDIPDRLTGLGVFKLPCSITVNPSVDLHSGFPYSNVDVFQNYVGPPNSRRFPTYFSLSWKASRDFPLPFGIHKGHKIRLGLYSVNTTSRENPHDVFNNVASPSFGTFTGLEKRINGIVIEFAN